MSLLDGLEIPISKLLEKIPWEEGRQGNGYKKLCLFSSPDLMMDCYLLYMPKGSLVCRHTDPVQDRDHYRINFILHKAKSGGNFVGNALMESDRLIYFRPDRVEHEVTKIKEGYRLVLSVGWAK